jgi:hypothetical protein
MQSELIKLAFEHPTSFSIIGFTCAAMIFNTGTNWSNFRYMREHMVSKKDLELALSKNLRENRQEFITRNECQLMMERRKTGR